MRTLIISPVRNEADHIERTIGAMAAQERRPTSWIIVDDGSSDGTFELATRAARVLPFVRVVRAPAWPDSAVRDHLALAKEARAFNHGLSLAGTAAAYDVIGKLDGDVELPPRWFAELLGRMEADPRLGVAGGRLVEPEAGGWTRLEIPDYHVHGAVKLYRTACFEAIGGMPERLGWDTIDETYARMHGWTTHSFSDLVARHHRAAASADGLLRGRARHGECAYILRYPVGWTTLRSVKMARLQPVGLSGAAFLYGYARAWLRRTPKVEDPSFRRFVRRELRGRMLAPLRG